MKRFCTALFIVIIASTTSLSHANSYKHILPSDDQSEFIIHHENYSLGYDEDTEQAVWVIYEYTKDEANTPPVKRKDKFRPDPSVPTGSAALSDYKKSGFDRGHLAPAADMAFSKQAMNDSFFMSNMSPQRPRFNRGIWKKLEAKVRSWAKKDTIIVVAAGVLKGSKHIGKNDVLVPEFYYKVIYVPSKEKAIAFLLPNKASTAPLKTFVIPIDALEEHTGIDFFPALDDDTENTLEQHPDLADWDW